MEYYLTPEEVAERFRVSQDAVRHWCRTGRLKATKAGKQWRIKPSDLEAFLNSREVQQDEPKKADGLAAFAS